ncbi:MAG: DNA repair protein RecO [Methylococcales bacterium]|nr:DNA repair protein RecO [Methylococcales bacterium]
MEAAVHLQPGFVLQHRSYRETSLLLDVFTRDYGIVSMLARGVRKEKSRLAGLLQPFSLLDISYLGRNELKTLVGAELTNSYDLQRLALYCGFYVNELLQRFLHKDDPHPQLFADYQHCLCGLAADGNVEQTLRYFELQLLQESGYGVQLDRECRSGAGIQGAQRYGFSPGDGMVADADGPVSGHTLALLAAGVALDAVALAEAKLLLRKMLDSRLQGRPLKSRDVLTNIIKHL